jgi:hypothetical protein
MTGSNEQTPRDLTIDELDAVTGGNGLGLSVVPPAHPPASVSPPLGDQGGPPPSEGPVVSTPWGFFY